MSRDKRVSYQDMVEANGEGYDPSDIRTYTCKPLASGPVYEVAIHISLYNEHKQGTTHRAGSWTETPYGGHFCEGSVEFNRKVAEMGLNFPKAANFKQIKLLKTAKLNTLWPSWIMERYDFHEGVVTKNDVPIFYDMKSDKFLVFLDTEFFKQTTPSGLNFLNSEYKHIYTGKDKKDYAAFRADSMTGLIDCLNGEPFFEYVKIYKQRFIDAAKGQRVICMAMKTKSNQFKEEDSAWGLVGNSVNLNCGVASRSNRNKIKELVLAQNTSFELYQGSLIDDLIYLMDDDGNIYPDAIMTSVKHARLREEYIKTENHGDYTFLMMPYTEQDWTALKAINNRLLSLMTELSEFFDAGYQQDALFDMSVNTIESKTPKLLKGTALEYRLGKPNSAPLAIKVAQDSYASLSFGKGMLSGDVANLINKTLDVEIEHDVLSAPVEKSLPKEIADNEKLSEAVKYVQLAIQKERPSSYGLATKDICHLIKIMTGETVNVKDIEIH